MIDLGRALKYPFSGPNAVSKTLIGGMLTLFIPLLVPLFILLGYELRIIRDVLQERDDELPDWDAGTDAANGLLLLLGTLVYYLPAIVLMVIAAGLTVQAFDGLNLARLLLEDTTWTLDRGALALAVLLGTIALVWMVLSAPFVMTGIARYAETGEFSTLLNVPEAFQVAWEHRAQAGVLMLYVFIVTVLSHMISAVAASACILPAYIQFIHFSVIAHLNGQWAAVLKTTVRANKPSVIRPIAPPPGRKSEL